MNFFNKLRSDGATHDGQGEERRGLVDVIKYNGEADDIIWKFPYDNISLAAQLVVNKSQEAVFVKGGTVCDVFGEGTHTLSAKNLPLLDKIINLPFGGNTPFTAEVWFINKVVRRGLKFGTPSPIRVIDPTYAAVEMSIPIRAHGDYSIRVDDSLLLLNEYVGTLHLLSTDDIVKGFSTVVVQELNKNIKKYSSEMRISPLDYPEYAPEIADYIKPKISEKFAEYGLSLVDFQFAHIAPNEDDPTVKQLYENRIEAVKERERRNIQGFTYQQERQFDILEAAASNEGTPGNIAGAGIGMGVGMGIGNMFGQQMAQTSTQMAGPNTPPPIASYYVYTNNVQQGPYDVSTLSQLIQSNVVTAQTLVWKQGMPAWAAAATLPELAGLFVQQTPPPPPPVAP